MASAKEDLHKDIRKVGALKKLKVREPKVHLDVLAFSCVWLCVCRSRLYRAFELGESIWTRDAVRIGRKRL